MMRVYLSACNCREVCSIYINHVALRKHDAMNELHNAMLMRPAGGDGFAPIQEAGIAVSCRVLQRAMNASERVANLPSAPRLQCRLVSVWLAGWWSIGST